MATADNSPIASYDAIKNAFNNTSITSLGLEKLKNHFQADIASKRLRECIRTVADLVNILERRDVISEYDINALHIVANHCMDNVIKEYLKHYTTPSHGKSLPYQNEYRELRIAESLRKRLHLNSHTNNSFVLVSACGGMAQQTPPPPPPTTLPINVFSTEKKAAVYKRLSKELGKYWRHFGRELGVTEGDMESIELQFPRDFSSRVYKLMQTFEEDESHDPKRHVLIICQALDECKRKDLRRKVEEIMSY